MENPDHLKQSTEIRFSKKSNAFDRVDLAFNKNTFHEASSQKHLGLILHDKLNFKERIDKNL